MRPRVALIISLLVLVSTTSLASSTVDPASTLCDRRGGATRSETATNIIVFQHSLEAESGPFELTELDHACVEARHSEVESRVAAYCDARAQAGHDLRIDPLTELHRVLESLRFECAQLRHEAEMALLEKMLPESCNELASSLRAFAEAVRTGREPDAEYADCIDANIEQLAPPVEEMCERGEMSLRPAFLELRERLAKRCKPSS